MLPACFYFANHYILWLAVKKPPILKNLSKCIEIVEKV